MSWAPKSGKRARKAERGMQLLEVALVLPMLLVLVAGVADFAQGWNMRQVLANAARDGARLGASQPFQDLDNTPPASIQQVCRQVASYLNQEHVNLAFMNNTGSSSSTISSMCSNPGTVKNTSCSSSTCVPLAWTYYSNGTSTGTLYGLKIERTVQVPLVDGETCGSVGVACTAATRVTLVYKFNWGMGFNHIVSLIGASNYSATVPIGVVSTMPDLAQTESGGT
jgi:Flp pilus assembly protein TadG